MSMERFDVVLEGSDLSFPAWIEPGTRWNGWMRPWFDRDVAERVVDWLNTTADELPPDDAWVRARWEGDTIVLIESDGVEQQEIRCPPDASGRYPIGAGGWTWSLVEE